MNEESITRLTLMLAESTEQLFSSHGVTLVPQSSASPPLDHSYAATLGFTGEVLAGALAITLETRLIQGSMGQGAPQTPDATADWAGELANQLLGRVKNKLLPHGIVLVLSTPVVFSGQRLRSLTATPKIHLSLAFEGTAGGCAVVLEGNYLSDFEIGEAVEGQEVGVSEGEMEFF